MMLTHTWKSNNHALPEYFQKEKMDDKILKKLKGTINKLALGFENSEGFDGHGKPHAVEGKLYVKTDSGVAFVFELDLTKKGKAHGEMCILHEDEDGDLVPVSLEEVEGHKEEKELKIEQYKLN